jgi:hypothetical protein
MRRGGADTAGEAIEVVIVGYDDAATERRRRFDFAGSFCREHFDVQRLFDHVGTLSPDKAVGPSDSQDTEDPQTPPDPSNVGNCIDGIDFKKLGQR